jgi:hypothetical protein
MPMPRLQPRQAARRRRHHLLQGSVLVGSQITSLISTTSNDVAFNFRGKQG